MASYNSILAIGAVFDRRLLVNPSTKLTLICLFDLAGGGEGTCWPSLGLLARRTSTSCRTVQRNIETLKQTGWLTECEGRANGNRIYRPNWERALGSED